MKMYVEDHRYLQGRVREGDHPVRSLSVLMRRLREPELAQRCGVMEGYALHCEDAFASKSFLCRSDDPRVWR